MIYAEEGRIIEKTPKRRKGEIWLAAQRPSHMKARKTDLSPRKEVDPLGNFMYPIRVIVTPEGSILRGAASRSL